MNRFFQPLKGALEAGLVFYTAKVAIGASGAPTLNTDKSKGVATVVRSATGRYVVTLQDAYNDLLFVSHCNEAAVTLDPATTGVEMRLHAKDVTNSSTPTFTVQMVTQDDGADADPANGVTLNLFMVLKGSSAN